MRLFRNWYTQHLVITTYQIPHYFLYMRVWWNWQTHRLEGSAVEIPYGFKSHHSHHQIIWLLIFKSLFYWSSRSWIIILFSVLSHHRTNCSVYGGSLNELYFLIYCRHANKTSLFQSIIGNCTFQNRAIGNSPIAFSCVRIFPCLISFYSKSNKTWESRTYPFPCFPDARSKSASNPCIYFAQNTRHIG